MKCPNCGLINPDDAVKCECDYSFTTSRFYRSYEDMRVRELFSNSWEVFGGNWATFLILAAIPTLVCPALALAKEVAGIETIKSIVVVLTTIPLMIAAHKASDGEVIGIGESYALSLGFFWRYIWTTFLYYLIMSGVGLVMILVFMLRYLPLFKPIFWYKLLIFWPKLIFWYKPIMWVLFFLLLVLVILLALRYFFAPFAVIIEGISGRAALSRSKSLTKGRLLRMLVLEVGFAILSCSFNGVPLALLVLLVGLFFGQPFIGFSKSKPVWAETIGLFGAIMVVGTFVIFNVLLFKSLRALEINRKIRRKTLDKVQTSS